MAAAVRSEGSRVRTFGLMYLFNFIRVLFFRFSVVSGLSAEHAMTISHARQMPVYLLHNIHAQSGLQLRDEQNDRLNEARQTPRTGHSPAARNPRSVPCAASNHLLRKTW